MNMQPRRGKFIVLEGTDGSGTTSQSRLLCDALAKQGISCVETREPSRGPVGQLLRAALEKRLIRDDNSQGFDWATLALLFAADRTDHLQSEVVPALAKGHWVISDRYTLSSLIYQSLTAPEEEAGLAWVRELNRNALRPDLVIVLDVSPEIAEGRRRARGGAEELFDRRELQAKLASAYLNAARYSTENLLHVDGAASMNAVAEQVILGVSQKFLR